MRENRARTAEPMKAEPSARAWRECPDRAESVETESQIILAGETPSHLARTTNLQLYESTMKSARILQSSIAALIVTTGISRGQTPAQQLQRPILEEQIPGGRTTLPTVVVTADPASYRA